MYIRNNGKLGFYYQWSYNDDVVDRSFHIELKGREGYVKSEEEIKSNIFVLPIKMGKIKNLKFSLKVTNCN